MTDGDSGGAWVGWRNGEWRLLTVFSGHPYYYQNHHLTFAPTPVAGMAPSNPAVESWIRSVIGSSRGDGGSSDSSPGGSTGGGATPPTPAPTAPSSTSTYAETSGPGPVHTWTNYTNAGGVEGPSIPDNSTVQTACKLEGSRVEDGNTWWYRIASSPWSNAYYASADAFYNNGATSGSLHGTPFVDPSVPNC